MDAAFNITMGSLHYAAKAYDIASRTLQEHNVTLPSPQIIVYTFQSAAQQLAFVVYYVQMYLSKDGEFVDSTPLSSNPRANYLRQQGVAP
ncbi:unnamed protein product [Umbelopsis ramanniana]